MLQVRPSIVIVSLTAVHWRPILNIVTCIIKQDDESNIRGGTLNLNRIAEYLPSYEESKEMYSKIAMAIIDAVSSPSEVEGNGSNDRTREGGIMEQFVCSQRMLCVEDHDVEGEES